MKKYFVTSIYTKHGEHIWTFQGKKQIDPKTFAYNQAVQCEDHTAATQILEQGALIRVY